MNLSQTYLQGQTHVLAGKVASTSMEDAVHCRGGCSALRLRRAKLAPKSPVLFYKVSDLHTHDHSGAVWKAKYYLDLEKFLNQPDADLNIMLADASESPPESTQI